MYNYKELDPEQCEFVAIGPAGELGDGDIEGHEVICPRHGARFDIRTGKVLSLPAIVDIPAYPVRVEEGQLEIGLPLEA